MYRTGINCSPGGFSRRRTPSRYGRRAKSAKTMGLGVGLAGVARRPALSSSSAKAFSCSGCAASSALQHRRPLWNPCGRWGECDACIDLAGLCCCASASFILQESSKSNRQSFIGSLWRRSDAQGEGACLGAGVQATQDDACHLSLQQVS
jgi:hypothetical protein